ncbi:MAG: hypothetical protein KJZ47_08570 [Gemmatimonadales bacterium]|nr:hypothetical protein [Gemmatimonadales bacterium]
MTRASRSVTLLASLLLLGVSSLAAQRPQTREGFWGTLGAGYATLGCNDCDGRARGGAGMLQLGGTLNQKWQLGASVTAWEKREGGATLTVGLLSAIARFYPSATGGFFLQGGAGIAAIDLGIGNVSATEKGFGTILGAGYDVRIGRNVSLTPFWNRVMSWYDNDGNLDYSQFGLAVTIH